MRDVLLAAISFAAGGLAGWLWFRSRVQKATAEARTDGLTGLLNRRGFDERLKSQHAQAVRYGLRYSVVLFDLDRFKQLNDTEGHAAGDALLVSLASRLRSLIRESDVPARYGGDEFVVLCPGTDEGRRGHAGGSALHGPLHRPGHSELRRRRMEGRRIARGRGRARRRRAASCQTQESVVPDQRPMSPAGLTGTSNQTQTGARRSPLRAGVTSDA